MKQVKINGIPYNAFGLKEKDDMYPHIENAFTNETPVGGQKGLLLKILAEHGKRMPGDSNTHSCVTALMEIADDINKKRFGSFGPWSIQSNMVCSRKCDDTFFKYSVITLPTDIRWFFGAEKNQNGQNDIGLVYKEKEYNASIQWYGDNSKDTRIRWEAALGKELSVFNDLDNQPELKFTQVGNNIFEIEMTVDSTGCNIDYIGVLDYLEKNREIPYSEPDTNVDSVTRDRLLAIKSKGQFAVGEMKKMSEACEKRFGLDKCLPISWLDSSNTKTRNSLCAQMKLSEYSNDPISISIFVEYNGKLGAQYRVSLDIKNEDADEETLNRYHSYLDIPVDRNSGLKFVFGTNEWGNPQNINEDQYEIREKIKKGTIPKVQLCQYIERADGESNDYYHRKLIEAVRQLVPYYKHVVGIDEETDESEEDTMEMSANRAFGLNTILYGPPGTGKTYNSVNYAVAICDDVPLDSLTDYNETLKRFNELKKEGRIAFTTFHQSYGYEEFIEGIKPIMVGETSGEKKDVNYDIVPGTFKEFCDNAKKKRIDTNSFRIEDDASVWKATIKKEVRQNCYENDYIRIDWEMDSDGAAGFVNDIVRGDIIITTDGSRKRINGVAIVTSDEAYELKGEVSNKTTRSVTWIAKNIDVDITDINAGKMLHTYFNRCAGRK